MPRKGKRQPPSLHLEIIHKFKKKNYTRKEGVTLRSPKRLSLSHPANTLVAFKTTVVIKADQGCVESTQTHNEQLA